MFFETDFTRAIGACSSAYGLKCGQIWNLAPDVFAARVHEEDQQDWKTIFYFDSRQIKLRDTESGAERINRSVQLLMEAGLTTGRLATGLEEEYISIAYFNHFALSNTIGILNCASQLFVRVDNQEIEWLGYPDPVGSVEC